MESNVISYLALIKQIEKLQERVDEIEDNGVLGDIVIEGGTSDEVFARIEQEFQLVNARIDSMNQFYHDLLQEHRTDIQNINDSISNVSSAIAEVREYADSLV